LIIKNLFSFIKFGLESCNSFVVLNYLGSIGIDREFLYHLQVMYMFITSLAVADVIVGLLAIPFAILTKLGLPRSSPSLCMVMLTFIIIPIVASIFHFMAISIER